MTDTLTETIAMKEIPADTPEINLQGARVGSAVLAGIAVMLEQHGSVYVKYAYTGWPPAGLAAFNLGESLSTLSFMSLRIDREMGSDWVREHGSKSPAERFERFLTDYRKEVTPE